MKAIAPKTMRRAYSFFMIFLLFMKFVLPLSAQTGFLLGSLCNNRCLNTISRL